MSSLTRRRNQWIDRAYRNHPYDEYEFELRERERREGARVFGGNERTRNEDSESGL